jgi:pyrimidine-nucleoside phosphorylase/thymidine phosphorylase
MSKKLAEGIDALVLDVKVGRGAFMKTRDDARRLALALIGIGGRMGKRVTALLTAMDQPLGLAVGNALEVVESVELLRGGGPADLRELTVALTAEMVLLAGLAPGLPAARAAVEAAIADGRGLARFRAIVAAQGGDPRTIDDPGLLPRATEVIPIEAPADGVVTSLDAEAVGLAAMALGAGRARVEDRIDPAVGVVLVRKVGDRVVRGEPLCLVHRNPGGEPQVRVAARLREAYRIGTAHPDGPGAGAGPLILERMAAP